ncbi:Kynureninase [Rhodococcus wratislaviensis]|uniref:Kynureninase n=1 Tax=Rhodococcus wratislaviensis TaxID=44752 RepID=A0A402CJN2_RHOWR|nr:kynureninase [Rhodococcus wratislaviensis]GCE43812.1 Kynureninase [Rhodococcus wratislaviensis]
MKTPTNRDDCEALDRDDPIRSFRDQFHLPTDLIYLDGNSLGALPKTASARMTEMVENEWGRGLIRSWNDAGWFDKPIAVGDRIAPLIGADDGEVVVCDSTSLNLFKVITAALSLRPDRRVVIAEAASFPTDLYMIEGATELLGGYERRHIGDHDSTLEDLLGEDVAVVVLSHVDYRTGKLHDMKTVTELVHRHGALIIWDLCHSVGAMPVHLNECGADFAVGCTYKYLNGGPGSPAFVFAALRHHDHAQQPLSGWHGHAEPFAFTRAYTPAAGIGRYRTGTPPLLSYAPLEATLQIWEQADLDAVRAKSCQLTDMFIALVERECTDWGMTLASPRDSTQRGSQVSFRHQASYEVMQALIAHGVIGDFRAPDLMRFGFPALYVRYTDVWDAVKVLKEILATEQWRNDRYATRTQVT